MEWLKEVNQERFTAISNKVTPEKSGKIGIGNLTAKIIASSNEMITGNINATGYAFGIYIGTGVTNVKNLKCLCVGGKQISGNSS